MMRTIDVEWRHLEVDGATCDRCGDTGTMLARLIAGIDRDCRPRGVRVTLRETALDAGRIGESNLVLIDGQPLEAAHPAVRVGQSSCASCSDLTGNDERCRTVEVDGRSHEIPPPDLLRDAICRVAGCC